VLTTPRPGALASCRQYLPAVDSAHLDCISDAIALLLAHAGVADVRAPFAADWRFDLVDRDAALPRLDLPPADLDSRLAARTGYTLDWHPLSSVGEALPHWRDHLAAGRPVMVVGDAFHLPWVPYAGHEHMDHGFVLDGLHDLGPATTIAQLVDPYQNTTEWGPALPHTRMAPIADLAAAVIAGRWAVLTRTGSGRPIDFAAQLADNATAIEGAHHAGEPSRFVHAHRALDEPALANLTMQTWLLARSRALHGRWLGDAASAQANLDPGYLNAGDLDLGDLADRFDRMVTQAWRRAAQAAYLALRRLRSGREVPPACLSAAAQATTAEAELAGRLRSRLADREP
jgi:hypothetical protein